MLLLQLFFFVVVLLGTFVFLFYGVVLTYPAGIKVRVLIPSLNLYLYLVYVSSEGSCESAHMRRLT